MADTLPTPAEILQIFYNAESVYMAAPPAERDPSVMAATLGPDFKMYQSPDLPYTSSVYEGHRGFSQWCEEMGSYFDRLVVEDPEVFEKAGSDEVMVKFLLKLRVRKTGEMLERPMVQVVSVDRSRGMITAMRPFYWDVQGLNTAVGK